MIMAFSLLRLLRLAKVGPDVYKRQGKNILEGMTMPEGAKPSVYESVFILAVSYTHLGSSYA